MTAHLTQAVLAGGRAFPAGTARQGSAAEVIPDGPWWSGPAEVGAPPVVRVTEEPPRTGKGSSGKAWRDYAGRVGVVVADDATRDDIIAAVDAARD